MTRFTVQIQGDTDDVTGVEADVRAFANMLADYCQVGRATVSSQTETDLTNTDPATAKDKLAALEAHAAAVKAKRDVEATADVAKAADVQAAG